MVPHLFKCQQKLNVQNSHFPQKLTFNNCFYGNTSVKRIKLHVTAKINEIKGTHQSAKKILGHNFIFPNLWKSNLREKAVMPPKGNTKRKRSRVSTQGDDTYVECSWSVNYNSTVYVSLSTSLTKSANPAGLQRLGRLVSVAFHKKVRTGNATHSHCFKVTVDTELGLVSQDVDEDEDFDRSEHHVTYLLQEKLFCDLAQKKSVKQHRPQYSSHKDLVASWSSASRSDNLKKAGLWFCKFFNKQYTPTGDVSYSKSLTAQDETEVSTADEQEEERVDVNIVDFDTDGKTELPDIDMEGNLGQTGGTTSSPFHRPQPYPSFPSDSDGAFNDQFNDRGVSLGSFNSLLPPISKPSQPNTSPSTPLARVRSRENSGTTNINAVLPTRFTSNSHFY